MPRLPLLGGAYMARSIIANAQRCVNLYPEKNPGGGPDGEGGDSPCPVTHYPTPGLLPLVQAGPNSPVRCLYLASNGALYAVIGAIVYLVLPDWRLVQLGTLPSFSTPVSMADNGTHAIIVDGTTRGYTIALANHDFAELVSDGFSGGTKVEYVDTYFVVSNPNGYEFNASKSNSIEFDPLYYAQKSGASDLLVALVVVQKAIWLFGALTTEVWYNSGGSAFPFASVPGALMEHGCAAPYSVAKADKVVFWLGQERQGQGIVYMGQGYQATRVSTHAIEAEFGTYPTLADARAYAYQHGGHFFYVINFPSADKTWVFDMATGAWHERAWLDSEGTLHRHRGVCHAFAYGQHLVGDHANGTIYAMREDIYTDAGGAIPRIRSFPHLLGDGKRVQYNQFSADLEVGNALPGDSPEIALRWSDTRGASWGNPVTQSMGRTGEYQAFPQWRRLGVGRDRVFELRWTAPHKTALNGAFIEAQTLGT